MVTFTNQKHIPRERRSGSQLCREEERGVKGRERGGQKLYWIVSRHLKVSERRPLSVHLRLSRMTASIFFLLLRRTKAHCFYNLARYPIDIIKQDRKNLRTRSKITAGNTKIIYDYLKLLTRAKLLTRSSLSFQSRYYLNTSANQDIQAPLN